MILAHKGSTCCKDIGIIPCDTQPYEGENPVFSLFIMLNHAAFGASKVAGSPPGSQSSLRIAAAPDLKQLLASPLHAFNGCS